MGNEPDKPLTSRERSNANLRSWKPGQTGNPEKKNLKGQPKIKDQLDRWASQKCPQVVIDELEKIFPNIKKNITIHDAWTLRVTAAALSGQPWAIKFLADRTEGTVAQVVNLQNNGGSFDHSSQTDEELRARLTQLTDRIAGLQSGAPTPDSQE